MGFKDLERTRADTRNRYRIEIAPRRTRTIRVPRSRTSRSRICWSTLFVQHEGRRLDSVQWLRETVGEAKLHEQATAQATRAAFVEFRR